MTYYNKEAGADYSNLILASSKNETNEIDLEFCNQLLELLLYCSSGVNIDKEINYFANILKKFQKADPINYKDNVQDLILQYQIGDINPF